MAETAQWNTGIVGLPWRSWGRFCVIVAEVCALGWIIWTEDVRPALLLALGVAAIIAVVLLFTRKLPWGSLVPVIVASALCRFAVEIGGLRARPEHLTIAVAAPILVIWGLRGGLRFSLQSFDYLLLAYIGVQFLSSSVMSPDPRLTVRWAIMASLAIVPYFLLRFSLRNLKQVTTATSVLLTVGSIEAAYGILCFLSNYLFNSKFGMEIGQYDAYAGTYATQFEANLFGAYCGASALIFLSLYLLGERRRRYLIGFALTFLAMLISLARAAIAGFACGAAIVLWYGFRSQRLQWRTVAQLLRVGVLTLALLSPILGPRLMQRISSLNTQDLLSDPTTLGRAAAYYAAYQNFLAHPVLGNGTNSFKLVTPSEEGFDLWLGNTPVRVLHDTGLVGLMVFLAFLVALARRGISVIRRRGEGGELVFALLASAALYCISFQATEATILAFPWVHLGLIAAAVVACEGSSA